MNAQHNIEAVASLAYSLRHRVRYYDRGTTLVLILNYPLKVVLVNPLWKPVFDLMNTQGFTVFQDIVPLIERAAPEEIEAYLNTLVRKGFLESRGYPTLAEYPFVSIIIPVKNRPDEVAECLQSLNQLDYPVEKREIIVVDDASDDHTKDMVATFPVHLISIKPHRQASFCRNLAAQKAKGDVLAFLDSDCLADPLWLKELVPAFRVPSNGAVGGVVDSWFNEKRIDRYEKVMSSLNMGTWPKSSREDGRFFYVPSCNLLVRKGLFMDLGGFREDMVVGEDVDFCWRLQDHGHHVEYRPMGRIFHRHRNKVIYFCGRRFDYGTSEPFLQRCHENRIKHFILPPLAVAFWGFLSLSLVSGWLCVLLLCCMIPLGESLINRGKLNRSDIRIKYPLLVLAAFRGYLAVIYHLFAFISRYYLYWALLFALIAPIVLIIILGVHLLTGIVIYYTKKPSLDILSFLFYFTLDQLSYQMGVWWGSLKGRFFGSVNPRIVIKSSS